MNEKLAVGPNEEIVAEVAGLAEAGGGRIGRFLYPMRLVGCWAFIAIVVLAARHGGGLRAFHYFLVALLLVYPHISRFLSSRLGGHRGVEVATTLVDDFVLGATVYSTGFSPVPTTSLLTVALANGMALGGPKLLVFSALVFALGGGIAMPFLGTNFAPRSHLEVDLTSAGFLLVYFTLFAYTAWARSLALIQSRRNMRQGKLAAEIETRKAEALLLAILPRAAAREFARRGEVEPRLFDEAVLLVVDLGRWVGEGAIDPAASVGDLNHCFKAFDAIGERHGLEPLKTTGNSWIAAAGVGGARGRVEDAVTAALEMRDLTASWVTGRQTGARAAAAPRFVVHVGWVLGGVVETHKFSYDVWGPVVDQVRRLADASAPGEVWISAEGEAKLAARFRRDPANALGAHRVSAADAG